MGISAPDPVAAALIRNVRERRVAEGLHCLDCGSTHVVRWGRFSGRQRYRCRSCGCCFSDLTATPLYYLKRLDAWPAYFRCLNSSQSLRRSAAEADVALSTSFRWRHLILRAIRNMDGTRLRGFVEFAHAYLHDSDKGPRRRYAPQCVTSRQDPCFPPGTRPGCIIIVARDRLGGQRAERVGTRTFSGEQVRALFANFLAEDATLLCNSGRLGPYARLQRSCARSNCRRLIRVPKAGGEGLEVLHNRNARGWIVQFQKWLVRFRGVSTRYVPSYLTWRRRLDLVDSGQWLEALMPCVARPPSPTLPEGRVTGR